MSTILETTCLVLNPTFPCFFICTMRYINNCISFEMCMWLYILQLCNICLILYAHIYYVYIALDQFLVHNVVFSNLSFCTLAFLVSWASFCVKSINIPKNKQSWLSHPEKHPKSDNVHIKLWINCIKSRVLYLWDTLDFFVKVCLIHW